MSDFQQQLASAQAKLTEGDFVAAEGLLTTLIDQAPPEPTSSECLYMLGVAQRYQERLQDALLTQQRLIDGNPAYARV